jgi:hypothetical protein
MHSAGPTKCKVNIGMTRMHCIGAAGPWLIYIPRYRLAIHIAEISGFGLTR